MHLNPKAMGYAVASFAAGFWLLVMGFSLLSGVGKRSIDLLGGLHPFYSYSWTGVVVMVVEHLIVGYIFGWVLAWLYNKFLKG